MNVDEQPKPSVLLLHNRYREPGGEERSVAAIEALLSERGHAVQVLERSSQALTGPLGMARGGVAMLRGGLRPAEVRAAVERTGADIVHVHNLTPLLGPRALAAARTSGARVVMHLHNYRLFCSIAIAYRDGETCMRCHGRDTLPGVRLRCRGNLPESLVYAAGLSAQQKRVLAAVDRFVVPSHAAATVLERFGMPADRMDVLHNFLPASEFVQASNANQGEHALFAGRLVEEKGLDTVVEAAARAGVPLLVAGEGPQAGHLRGLAAGAAVVRFSGRLNAAQLAEARQRAAFAVVPSRWQEPCPYVAIEGMAAGLPVLASDVGGLPELVGEQATLPARSPAHWAAAMQQLWGNADARLEQGQAALDRARELFGPERFYSGLMDVYARALAA